tara:strand:- start:7628 stop:8674 length:1047 start_codon:yes stop_codon:yes gene_type:complete
MNVGQEHKRPALSEDTVAAFLVSGVLSAAHSFGLDISACMRAAVIAEAELDNPTNRIEFPNFIRLLLFIQQQARDDSIGLYIGRELAFANYYALGYAAANGDTLFDALQVLPRYESLVVSSANTEIIDLRHEVEVHWSLTGGIYLAMLEDIFFASWITQGKQLAGTDELTTAVHFTHPAPDNPELWHQTYGTNLFFDQAIAKVIYHKDILALPILEPDPFVHQVMTEKADTLVAEVKIPCFTRKVINCLTKQLPLGEPDQQAIASQLNISERTLRRHLQQENTSYQALLDAVRRQRANYYLHQTSLSLQEISSRLGYQHLTAFNAAYKRWTGRTPARSRTEGPLRAIP